MLAFKWEIGNTLRISLNNFYLASGQLLALDINNNIILKYGLIIIYHYPIHQVFIWYFYRKYYGKIHPLVGILLLKIGKIMLFKCESVDAQKYIKEADKILSITHGKNHILYKESLFPLLKQASKEIDVIQNGDVYL